jgi:hypothetical protein
MYSVTGAVFLEEGCMSDGNEATSEEGSGVRRKLVSKQSFRIGRVAYMSTVIHVTPTQKIPACCSLNRIFCPTSISLKLK